MFGFEDDLYNRIDKLTKALNLLKKGKNCWCDAYSYTTPQERIHTNTCNKVRQLVSEEID